MTGYLLNLDDDRHGRTPAAMRHLYGVNDGQVPWCLVCGDWHPAGAMHTTEADPLVAILRVAELLERATAPVTTCDGCGCLVRDLEVCPGCEAARLHHPSCPRRIDAGADCIGCDPLTGQVLPTGVPLRPGADGRAAARLYGRDERGSAAWGAAAILACFSAIVVTAVLLLGAWLDQAGAAEKPRGHGCRQAARCHQVKPPPPAPTPIAPGCAEYGPACVIDLTGTWPTTPPVVIVQTFPPSFELP